MFELSFTSARPSTKSAACAHSPTHLVPNLYNFAALWQYTKMQFPMLNLTRWWRNTK